MILKYDLFIEKQTIFNRLQNLINQTYKLLPSRQEGTDWQKPLETIIEELAGMKRILNGGYSQIFFSLICKLEGLYSLTKEQDFFIYRRIIFECLGLMNTIQKQICHQNY